MPTYLPEFSRDDLSDTAVNERASGQEAGRSIPKEKAW
jgi:hypothetical protein